MLTAAIAEIVLDNNKAYQNARISIESMNPLTDGKSNTFIEAASWADDIRSDGTNFW